jgi:hypothetical protein
MLRGGDMEAAQLIALLVVLVIVVVAVVWWWRRRPGGACATDADCHAGNVCYPNVNKCLPPLPLDCKAAAADPTLDALQGDGWVGRTSYMAPKLGPPDTWAFEHPGASPDWPAGTPVLACALSGRTGGGGYPCGTFPFLSTVRAVQPNLVALSTPNPPTNILTSCQIAPSALYTRSS